jgi:hypothetical protein
MCEIEFEKYFFCKLEAHIFLAVYIVTCRVARVTKITGSVSGDWIY